MITYLYVSITQGKRNRPLELATNSVLTIELFLRGGHNLMSAMFY